MVFFYNVSFLEFCLQIVGHDIVESGDGVRLPAESWGVTVVN